MNIAEYQEFTRTTAIYPKDQAHAYLGLALCNEVTELAEKLTCAMESQEWVAASIGKNVIFEAGDCAYYIARIADEYDAKLSDVMGAAKYDGSATIPTAILHLVIAAGRLAGREKKKIRDGATWDEQKHVDNLKDIMLSLSEAWSALSVICRFFGYSMEQVLYLNHDKLSDRKDRGVLCGDGDHR